MYMEVFDVVVVGAGNGGLTAAATTAKAGLKTLVLERNNLPGGCAHSFIRGRFEFELALHQLCGGTTCEASESTIKIFERLAVTIPFHYEKNLFRAILKGENGYNVRVRSGYENFLEDMEQAVPGCRKSIEKLLSLNAEKDKMQTVLASGTLNPLKIIKYFPGFSRLASHSIDEVMDACGVPKKAQSIFNSYWSYLGVPTDDLNAMHYLSMVSTFIKTPPSMPYLRSYEIALALANIIQSHAGEVRYNSEVTKFLYNEKGACIGVEVDGKEIFAKKVISNIIPNNVWNISNEKFIPKRARKLANARKPAMSFITVYLGLNSPAEELGVNDYSYFIYDSQNTREQFNHFADCSYYCVNCLNNALPHASKIGTSMLLFTIPIMPDDFPADLSPREYKRYKNDFARRFIEDFEKTMQISITEHIEEIEIATPAYFAQKLNTPGGCAYGYTCDEWDNIINRMLFERFENRVPNLYFCGGHGSRGDGFPSAYSTGAQTGERIIKELRRKKK